MALEKEWNQLTGEEYLQAEEQKAEKSSLFLTKRNTKDNTFKKLFVNSG